MRRRGAVAAPASAHRPRVRAGKTHDLAWLATRSGAKEVVGVEYVQQAVEDFAKEHAELKLKKCDPAGSYSRRSLR